MKQTYLQTNTNTNEQSRYLSGICEFHPVEILLKEQNFDPKGKPHYKRFGWMKAKYITIIVVFFIAAIINKVDARLLPGKSVFELQLQKSLFVSGDKIWFKNSMASGHENNHQTILYVDLCGEGSIINSCIVKRENNHWEGNLLIPDSLETGIYLLRAYSGNYDGKAEMIAKLIPVVNRFGNNKTNENKRQNSAYSPIDLVHSTPANEGSALSISSQSSVYKTSSAIDLKVEKSKIPLESGVSVSVYRLPDDSIVQGCQADPEEKVVHSSLEQTKIFNKLTMCGKIVEKGTKAVVAGVTVLFSIPDSIPRINYAITDENGEFIFEVGDYYGTQDVIVQTLSKDKEYEIVLYPNLLIPPVKIPFYVPSELESNEFVTLTVKQSSLNKAYGETKKEIVTQPSYKFPFYGYTENILIPSRYVDLDNFEEISKELLPLCRIKKEKKEMSLNIYDPDNLRTSESPWILVDGVPVFNLKLVLPFNSQMLTKIETQKDIRCYGGLYIDGALSIFTRDGHYPIALPANAVRKQFETFHYKEDFSTISNFKGSLFPDFRDVLYWDPAIEPFDHSTTLKVQSSLEKGIYAAVVQGMDQEGNIHRSVFKFAVK